MKLIKLNGCQVTDYLLKKGFTKTEATFRKESAQVNSDGRPTHPLVEDMGPERYLKAFSMLKRWIDGGLDLYKASWRSNAASRMGALLTDSVLV